ncbi:hypothetical protein AMECASPLE_033369, partial [Ameca splendens]
AVKDISPVFPLIAFEPGSLRAEIYTTGSDEEIKRKYDWTETGGNEERVSFCKYLSCNKYSCFTKILSSIIASLTFNLYE